MSYVGLFAVLLILSALSACALALYALTRRDVPSAPAFMLLLAGEFIWATGYLRELGADGLTAKLFWDNLQFIGMQLCGVGALVFALVYSRNERVARRIRPLLWVEPSLTTLVVWTSARHGWLRSAPAIDTSTGYPQLVYEYGPWFWVSATSNLSLVVLALGVLGAFASRVRGRYRSSALIVIAGLSAPVAGCSR